MKSPSCFAVQKPAVASRPRVGRPPAFSGAFTRMELVALLACLALLVAVVFPALCNTQRDGERVVCLNNLRLIGRAFQIWSKDHGQVLPWRVLTGEGGTQRPGKAGAAWYEYAFISNELVTPRILACPSDDQKMVAKDFSPDPDGGFLHPSYRDNALSCWIGLDAGYVLSAGGALASEATPDHAVAGDRNLRVNGLGFGCSSGVNNAAQIYSFPAS